MLVSNCTADDLHAVLDVLNKEMYEGNIRFKDIRPQGRQVRFTLTVNSSKGPGGRIGFGGRRVAAACWHVHGNFFDALFKVCPDAKVRAGQKVITKDQGNWEDWNIGSMMEPMMYSEACDCDEQGIGGEGEFADWVNPEKPEYRPERWLLDQEERAMKKEED